MPKFVCQYAEVKKVGTELKSQAEEMNSSITTFDNGITSDLQSWTGEAKTKFTESLNAVQNVAKTTSSYAEKLGQHIEDAATKIEECDNSIDVTINYG